MCLRSSAWSIALFPFHVHPTGSAHSLHRFGVAHQTSLRSLLTVMSSSNSPHLGEAGRLFRVLVTAPQDRFYRSIRADGIASSQKGAIPLSTVKSDSLA